MNFTYLRYVEIDCSRVIALYTFNKNSSAFIYYVDNNVIADFTNS